MIKFRLDPIGMFSLRFEIFSMDETQRRPDIVDAYEFKASGANIGSHNVIELGYDTLFLAGSHRRSIPMSCQRAYSLSIDRDATREKFHRALWEWARAGGFEEVRGEYLLPPNYTGEFRMPEVGEVVEY